MATSSTPRRSRRKALALMEVVSHGTPQKIFAREGHCHRISPQPKPYETLRGAQVGVKRTLVCDSQISSSQVPRKLDPATLAIIQGLVDASVAEALEKQEQKITEKVSAQIRNEFGITLRSLISEWVKCPSGKAMLQRLTNALNKSYSDHKVQRRVLASDILQEIKQLIKGVQKTNLQFDALLKMAEETIEQTTSMPGDELVALLRSYLQTNQQVHVEWSEQALQDAVGEASKGKLNMGEEKRTNWVNKMASDIASARGWRVDF